MPYPKEVYDLAWAELARRGENARQQTAQRHEEIRRILPDAENIGREIARTAGAVVRAIIASPEKSEAVISALRDENLKMQNLRAELLTKHGYAPDYLDEKFACPKCCDKGFVGTNRCDCFESILKQSAYRKLGNISGGGKHSFENFSLENYPNNADSTSKIPRQRMSEILESCKNYASKFSLDSGSILMLGETGLGKTHLSYAIAASATEKGYGVLFTLTQKLIDRLESEKFSRAPEGNLAYQEHMEYVLNCDLLVLDDLGTEFATSFTSSALYNIVNTRLTEKRPTIINANLTVSQIEEKYSQRMVSRLIGCYNVLGFCGTDVRFILKK